MTTTPERQAYWLLKDVNRAIREFDMIRGGERVAVALSGGKDSFSLLRLLDLRRKTALESYELVAIHVNADGRGPWDAPHAPLVAWLDQSGIPYRIQPLTLPPGEPGSWTRRRSSS